MNAVCLILSAVLTGCCQEVIGGRCVDIEILPPSPPPVPPLEIPTLPFLSDQDGREKDSSPNSKRIAPAEHPSVTYIGASGSHSAWSCSSASGRADPRSGSCPSRQESVTYSRPSISGEPLSRSTITFYPLSGGRGVCALEKTYREDPWDQDDLSAAVRKKSHVVQNFRCWKR